MALHRRALRRRGRRPGARRRRHRRRPGHPARARPRPHHCRRARSHPGRPRGRARRRWRPPRAAHRGDGLSPGRDAAPHPFPPGGDLVMTPTLTTRAWEVAATVLDPELPVVTIADLGILRDVTEDDRGRVHVQITPTYSGCPAMETIRTDLIDRLSAAGYSHVDVEFVLSPAWTTDWL